ncbi:head GIN domain-containing protein [Mangrovimonas cancribranchiae]|uniref:Head GIN domain-containing protein n=1 Tax=Mangrovimonas cancribranchiae TaxID=3080055 RepID=A0AAU6P5R7_9FLAO
MKKLLYIIILIGLFSCDSEDANDCFQTSGETVQEEITVATFNRILVNRNVQLILKDDIATKVVVESGKNLINDVEIKVENSKLIITDNNTCNYARDYAPTKVHVTSSDISEIRTSSQFEVLSDGVLSYNNLTLLSEDYNGGSEFTVGDFRLQLDCNRVRVTSNNISSFYLSGTTNNLSVGFFAGTGRFEGANLIAEHVEVNHRGSNDMIVNPQQELTGVLRGTGNVISVNQPPVVTVERLYTGELIFW